MKKLFTPGPTNVPEFVRDTYKADCYHHRKGEFHEMFEGLNKKLKQVFKCDNDVIVLTASGTGSMEASVLNFFSEGDQVLVINTGVFGSRFAELCQIHKLEVVNYEVEYGNTFQLDEIEKLVNNYQFKGVFMNYSETSTGMLNDVESIGELLKGSDTLLIVDAISGLIVNDLNMKDWGIDVCLASSQKGFLLPPGISLVALSDRALKRMETVEVRSMYFDLKRYLNMYQTKLETPFTPAVFEIRALDKALDYLLQKGLDNIQSKKIELKEKLINGFKPLGFIPFSIHTKNNTLVAFKRNDNLDISKYITYMESKNYIISGGQKEMAGKIIRVGLIGEFDQHDIDGIISETEIYFKEIDYGQTV